MFKAARIVACLAVDSACIPNQPDGKPCLKATSLLPPHSQAGFACILMRACWARDEYPAPFISLFIEGAGKLCGWSVAVYRA